MGNKYCNRANMCYWCGCYVPDDYSNYDDGILCEGKIYQITKCHDSWGDDYSEVICDSCFEDLKIEKQDGKTLIVMNKDELKNKRFFFMTQFTSDKCLK